MGIPLADLEARLRILLPENYRDSFDDLRPAPMRSAGLKYTSDGRVAWNEIWTSFCDLAMAGGPPHKGRLLEPASPSEIEATPARYDEVVAEICRGVELVTSMPCEPAPDAGWVRVECYSEAMANWLVRAITVENVSVKAAGVTLDLPASPRFQLDKEIKNVITVLAKTSHYWLEHMPRTQQRAIASLFARLAEDAPLVAPPQPAMAPGAVHAHPGTGALAATLSRMTRLPAAHQEYTGWLGLTCPNVRAAVWMMRGLVAMNVLARREELSLFVPVNPEADPNGARVVAAVRHVHRLAGLRGVI